MNSDQPMDGLLDSKDIGQFLGHKPIRTGRRFLENNCPIPTYLVRGRRYVKHSELLAWIDLQKVEPATPQSRDLKSAVRDFLALRRARAS